MKTHHIYTLEDTRFPGIIRYVGRTNDTKKRLNEHKRCRGTECHKIHWIKSVLAAGGDIKMVSIQEFPKEEIEQAEIRFIEKYLAEGANLTNSTSRSWGVVEHSPEVVAKMAEIQKNRKAEINAKISATLTGRKMDPETYAKLLVKVNSPEWKEKMSKVHKGKTLTDEQKAHLSAFHTGRTRPPETGAKISAALKGKKKTPEHVEKSAAAHRGKKWGPQSAEHRAKLSAAQKGIKRGPQSPEVVAARVAARKATIEAQKLQLVTQP